VEGPVDHVTNMEVLSRTG